MAFPNACPVVPDIDRDGVGMQRRVTSDELFQHR